LLQLPSIRLTKTASSKWGVAGGYRCLNFQIGS
jgi:hypothetical protein